MRRLPVVAILLAGSTATLAASHSFPKSSPGIDSNDAGDVGVAIVTTVPAVDAGLPFSYLVEYENISTTPAKNGVIRISLPAGSVYRTGPDYCVAAGENVVCAVGDIIKSLAGPYEFRFEVLAPPANATLTLPATALITADQGGALVSATFSETTRVYRAFAVTTTADSGPGSLREAILSANTACTDGHPCKIAFAIPDPPVGGVQTIRPLTALPHVEGWNVTVDGVMQTTLFGDSNPAGPEVQLLGDQLQDASDGLVIETSCNATVQGLVVSGFTGAGITLLEDRCPNPFYYSNLRPEDERLARTISGNYLGTDPTGTRAVPNYRGIMARGGAAAPPIRIEGNVISGNVRSGIFLESGRGSFIVRNTIGLTASRTAALGNGASGIYIGPDAWATDVVQNMIAFNHDSGISIAAPAVELGSNSIFANYQLAIDLGLDGPTPPTAAVGGALLHSARYDPVAGVTVIEGEILGGVGISRSTIDFFANDAIDIFGNAQAQYVLGSGMPGNDYRHFAWSYAGDLRGKYVSATVTRNDYFGFVTIGPTNSWQGFVTTTSEVSRPIVVQ